MFRAIAACAGLSCAFALCLPAAAATQQAGKIPPRAPMSMQAVADMLGMDVQTILATDGIVPEQVAVRPQADPKSAIVASALAAVGVKYKRGMADLQRGVDCSGLVKAVYKAGADLDLPHRASAQARLGQTVDRQATAPGDLIFFNTRGGKYSHVGIVTADNEFVHASTIEKRVTVSKLNNPYWRRKFTEAMRLPMPAVATRKPAPSVPPQEIMAARTAR